MLTALAVVEVDGHKGQGCHGFAKKTNNGTNHALFGVAVAQQIEQYNECHTKGIVVGIEKPGKEHGGTD